MRGALNPGVRPREAFAWALYDFANSGYTTVVLTAGALTSDTLILRRWSVFTVANAYTKAEVDARTMAQPVPVTGTMPKCLKWAMVA